MRRYWIFSPLQDLTFVLLTPLPILLAFAVARRGGWTDGLLTFGLALAMAHYLPGILRAYGDTALFRRFRLRLIAAPVFLFSVTAWFAYLNLHIVILIALLWGQWHWMMQVYGFARIYDAKADPEARTSSRLDQLICLTWFGMCVFVLNNDLPSYVTRFYESGGPLLPAYALAGFSRGWLVLTAVATLVYAIQTVQVIRKGGAPNPLKFVFIAATFVYLSYTVSVIERPLMGLVMFEAWHDVQYLAIVWLFNLNRARNASDAGPMIRFLFRPKAILIMTYVGLCLAFGSLTYAWSLFENPGIVRIAVSLVTATGMLHYYLDGFIWKIREKETRQSLGVELEGQRAPATSVPIIPSWIRQAALWLLFGIPGTLFFVIESKGKPVPKLVIYENVASAFPQSVSAHYQLGRELQDVGRLREARVHYERALESAPNMLPARVYLGMLLSDQGDFAGARPHLEQALSIDPDNASVHNNLGIALDELGDLQNAKKHLELAVQINPRYALAHNNLGIVLAKLGNNEEARAHRERAAAIDPRFAEVPK
jgi:tetratricopeptide (TPR) repeat protein